MKKRLLCVLSIIAVVAILIPSGSALAWDSRTMNRISNEYAHVYWIDKFPDGPDADDVSDGFAVVNINVNKTNEGTYVNFNANVYGVPYFDQTPGNRWPDPIGNEWGGIYTTEDVFSLAGKKVLTGATLSSVTIPLKNSFNPPRPARTVTLQIDWTASGMLYTSSERGQYTSGDTTVKYSQTREDMQAKPVGTLTVDPRPPVAPALRPIPAHATGNIGIYERTETIVDK